MANWKQIQGMTPEIEFALVRLKQAVGLLPGGSGNHAASDAGDDIGTAAGDESRDTEPAAARSLDAERIAYLKDYY